MILRRLLLTAVLLASVAGPASFTAGAAGPAPEQGSVREILENVRRKYDAIGDADVKFLQRVKFSLSKVEQSLQGTLLLKKQNRYRIELGDQTIVTDGATVWSYSAARKQVVIDHFKVDQRSLTPERLLTGRPEGFVPVLAGKEKLGKSDAVLVKLIPEEEQALVSSIRLWIDDHDWMVRQVEVTEAGGKRTTYVVQQTRLNGGLPDSAFSFQAPEGTDVVDLR